MIIPFCYIGDFELNENNRWEWRWTSDICGCIAIIIIESTSYSEMYHHLQNKLNVDQSQYDMQLRYLFNSYGDSSIPMPLVFVTNDAELNYLLELNKMHRTPTVLGVTLIKKDVIEGERENSGKADNNDRGFWETVEIVPADDVVIPETVAFDRDVAVTHRIPSTVDDNENINEFTNENLIALSQQKYEPGGSLQVGTSVPSSNSSRVAPDDEDLLGEAM
ncbi:uncharacterized protein LOC111372174 isoform X2 [Olea europaea var. sylvestris]|uniref:uncharacterized protein LOC111372174 isoform X2 n=1 Tax=Olea europaea var. sylvestris TaxID=158386 RepID=UPI000C1D8AFE|nr:uncharacterized protein LOC111372174 isoform X2 [Olea europaea var. sylvestris]